MDFSLWDAFESVFHAKLGWVAGAVGQHVLGLAMLIGLNPALHWACLGIRKMLLGLTSGTIPVQWRCWIDLNGCAPRPSISNGHEGIERKQ